MSVTAAVAAVLVAPAAANAATTYTVAAGGGTCGAGDVTCESLAVAAGAVAAGDTVVVSPGTYAQPSNFAVPVTITGAAGVAVTGTITFSGAGANPSVLEKVVVVTSAGPAVSVTGSAGVAVRDSALISAADQGMSIANGAGNSITRTSVYSAAAGTAAVLVQPGAAATSLALESSVLSGGSGGAGLRVRTGVGSLPGGAGGATVTAQHITVAGAANGIVLDSSAALPLLSPVGNIQATVSDSIVLGANSATPHPGLVLVPANSATLTFTANNDTTSTPEALFTNPARRNYHLRSGSPAIDKAVSPGTSPTDVDGQPRTNGAASDLGADEFYVGPPPPAPPAGTGAPQTDGTAPAIVITKPRANQRIKLSTTKRRTVTVDGERVTRRTTTRLKRIVISGTAKDASGVKGVVLTLEKLGGTSTTKCKWFNPSKGIVLRSCKKPPLILAKLAANGTWTYNVNARRLSAGRYRIMVVGADNSGAFGNSAKRGDAIRRITLTKK